MFLSKTHKCTALMNCGVKSSNRPLRFSENRCFLCVYNYLSFYSNLLYIYNIQFHRFSFSHLINYFFLFTQTIRRKWGVLFFQSKYLFLIDNYFIHFFFLRLEVTEPSPPPTTVFSRYALPHPPTRRRHDNNV